MQQKMKRSTYKTAKNVFVIDELFSPPYLIYTNVYN